MLDRKRPFLECTNFVYFQGECLTEEKTYISRLLFLGEVTEIVAHDSHRMCRVALVKILGVKNVTNTPTLDFYGRTVVMSQFATGSVEIVGNMLLSGCQKVDTNRWGVLAMPDQRNVCPRDVEIALDSLFCLKHTASDDKNDRAWDALRCIVQTQAHYEVSDLLAAIFVLFDINDDDINYARLLCNAGN